MRYYTVFAITLFIFSVAGCNRVGSYVATILPKKSTDSSNAVSSPSSVERTGVDDDTIRPDNASSPISTGQRQRQGILNAPGGDGIGNGYDDEEYQQMMASGVDDPSAQLDQSSRPMGAMPGNPEYGVETLKHPNEEMIGVGGQEYKLFAEGGLKAPGSDMFGNMAANFYAGIDNADGEYASPVPQGFGVEPNDSPMISDSNGSPTTPNAGSNLPSPLRPKPKVGQAPNTLTSKSLVELTLDGALARLGNDVQVMTFAFRYQQLTAERLQGNFFVVINASNGGGVHAQPVKINGSGKFTVLTQLRPASRPFTAYLLMQQGDRRQIISRQIDVPFNPGF